MRRILSGAVFALLVSGCGFHALGQQNSEQVVFSGLAQTTGASQTQSPVGFWIWCESDSSNPYEGRCNGAMYVYALGITEHVAGTITESQTVEHQYTMSVSSKSLACSLT